MSTGAQKVDIFLKKFLSQQEVTDNFFDYLQDIIEENFARVYDVSGVFEPNPDSTPLLSSSGIDTFDLVNPLKGTNGPTGKQLSLPVSLSSAIDFENTVATDYFVGLRYIQIPEESEVNVRTAAIKFSFLRDAIGVRAAPDLVVDDGDETLTIRVNSVTEAGVSNAGRTVRVWLIDPPNEAQIFEELTVQFDGSNNFVETTTGLGQTDATPLSTDQADYQAALLGPEVKRNTDLRNDPDVMFVGIIEGAGAGVQPSAFDETDVNNLSFSLFDLFNLFIIEHDSVDGHHTDVTVETITTIETIGGVQFSTKVDPSDEDTPDVPVSHTLFSWCSTKYYISKSS